MLDCSQRRQWSTVLNKEAKSGTWPYRHFYERVLKAARAGEGRGGVLLFKEQNMLRMEAMSFSAEVELHRCAAFVDSTGDRTVTR